MDDLDKLNQKMTELSETQKRVDELLQYVPDGPDKQRLLAMREDSRGFFSEYIMPTWNKIKAMASDAFSGYGDFGFIPVAIWAGKATALALAASILTYVVNNTIKEQRILSDPTMKAAEKAMLLQRGGILGEASNLLLNAKNLALVGAGLLGLYMIYKFQSRAKR